MALFLKAKGERAKDLGDRVGSLFGCQEIEHIFFLVEPPLLRWNSPDNVDS